MLIDNRDNGGSKCIYLNAGPSIVTVSRLMRKYTHMHTDTPYQ